MDMTVVKEAVKETKTPFYIFDLDSLREKIRGMKKQMGEAAELCYAIKANPFLIPEIEPEVSFVEACSLGEIRNCMEQKIPFHKIIMSGVLKKTEELDEIFEGEELPVMTAESVLQFIRIRKRAEKTKKNVNVLLRLTSGNQFGMNLWEIESLIANRKNSAFVHIIGIHYFSGTKKKKKEKIMHELLYLDDVCRKLKEDYGFLVSQLEYGPGIDIGYFQNECAVRERTEHKRQMELLDDMKLFMSKMKFQGKLVLEIGRYFTAECGAYVTKVQEIKENANLLYAITDGGIHQMNYDGQIYGMFLPEISQIPERKNRKKETRKNYDLCGALCTSNDVLAKQVPLYPLVVGDYLVFYKTGAYAMTEGMALFLSRDLPAVVTYSKADGYRMLRTNKMIYELNMRDKGENDK